VAVITFAAWEFRPRRWTSIAAVAGIALTLALGQWQIGRAEYKESLQARYDALSREPAIKVGGEPLDRDGILLRRVEVRGEYAPKFTVFVDNRIHRHQPGFHVATPLRIAGSQRYVLVNRGWVASPRDRSLPAVSTPAGEQVVQGIAVGYSERYLELSTKVAEGNVWQNLVFERFRQATGAGGTSPRGSPPGSCASRRTPTSTGRSGTWTRRSWKRSSRPSWRSWKTPRRGRGRPSWRRRCT